MKMDVELFKHVSLSRGSLHALGHVQHSCIFVIEECAGRFEKNLKKPSFTWMAFVLISGKFFLFDETETKMGDENSKTKL